MNVSAHHSSHLGFDYIELWVGNAKQAASFYKTRLGFSLFAYRGLETGSRTWTSYALRQGEVTLVVSSALPPGNETFNAHLARHGDAVRDIALAVTECESVYERAMAAGAVSVHPPQKHVDAHGHIVLATIKTVGDTIHTFVERSGDGTTFLPDFVTTDDPDSLTDRLPSVGGRLLDHIGLNIPEGDLEPLVEWYERVLGFHRFFSIDDSIVHTEFSGLRSIVMADPSERTKIPLIEPASGFRKGQVEEFLEYHKGAGAQHFAILTDDILASSQALRERGVETLKVPSGYYTRLRELLQVGDIKLQEDVEVLAEYDIMVDFDENGYLLQKFTKPMSDRPTAFFEFLQRRTFNGFGANNFRAIFEAIEQEQERRGNLQ
ncbi:4-hydroxyphenylpyruvate dioxygenase [Nostoc cf. edaphicum LEGE 07299]|uniref:4-hydroxyphenylpyruvate dioxygenase n=1 Tax=Nostoc cf. edaphicum LEGE 07299 TaxID=2777974 RepID=A0ABR9TZU6_9NOSO|nr:4-hydroxyphenylpyruvate dioxygenase [Nostoc edaphicum]MBE9105939.1 4-hydroxyphenylpyruvate dioxygenase [Nostoc cf. edaphicum LEGE 07299]